MIVQDLFDEVEDFIGDTSSLREAQILRVANRVIQSLYRRYKCKFALRKGSLSTGSTVATTKRARLDDVVTLTTAAHGLVAGDRIVVADVSGTGYNGSYDVVSAPSTTTLTYACSGDDETEIADTGGTIFEVVSEYVLPADFYKPLIGREISSSDNWLRHITYKEYRRENPDSANVTEDVPSHYMIKKYSWVDAQPKSAVKLACVSGSNGDTGVLSVVGLVSGIEYRELITLTGTASVNSANTYDAEGIISISQGTESGGTVSVTASSPTVTVSTLIPAQKDKQRVVCELHPRADAAYTLYFDYFALHPKLVSDSDRVLIPEPYEDWLPNKIAAEISVIDGHYKKAAMYGREAEIAFQQMMDDDMISPDEEWTHWATDLPDEFSF